jgi:hypothetical protein
LEAAKMPKRKKAYSPIVEKQNIQSELDINSRKFEEWGIEQLQSAGTKNHLSAGIISAVKEAVAVPEKFTADMKHLKNLLITLSENSKINDNEKKIIDNYISKIDKLVELYNELNSDHPLIVDKNTSPEDVIKGLNAKYNDPRFYAMMDQYASLEYDRVKIDSISAKYEPTLIRKNSDYNEARTSGAQTRQINTLTSMPMQNLPRISMVIRALNEQITKFEAKEPDYHLVSQPIEPSIDGEKEPPKNAAIESLFALTVGCLERSGPKNTELQVKIGEKLVANQVEAQYLSKESGASAEKKQAFFLREILQLNLNTPIEKKNEARIKDLSAYLEEIAVRCYPQTFTFNSKGELSVKAGINRERYLDIYKAIGFDVMDRETLSQKINLSPARFDAKALDKLYKADHNPLWLVLKSTKPVDKHFTAQDKVKAYIELAQAYKDEKIGEKEKYLGAYNAAQAALAVAEKDPACQKLVHEAFGSKSELGQWIISKHSKEDQAKVSENLSKYSHVKYISEQSHVKKQVISPSQALLLLIDHYKKDPEKVAELKKLYLSGVRIEQGDNKRRNFEQNAEDLLKVNQYLADSYLSSYEISMDRKTISNDPTRRYFETHLAYETVKHQIDSVDKELLQKQVDLLTTALTSNDPDSEDAKVCARVLTGETHKDDSKLYKEYANYIAKIKSGELYKDLNPEQREKIILVVQSSLLGVANAQARPQDLPLNIYKTAALYSDHWKGKVAVEDQDSTANPHMGLMKNYMPIAQSDIGTSTNPAPPVKPSDQATFVGTKDAKWVEMNFAGLVHPFSNAISGTMLCQLRNLAEQHKGDENNSSGITASAEAMERYSRLFIATMLYGSGGHSLNEYTYPLQLDEVRNEFGDVEGFTEINMGTMFLEHNTVAFDAALSDAIIYNAQTLQRQRLNQDINYVGLLHDQVAIAKSIDVIVQKKEQYESEVEKMPFSKHRTAREKVDIIKPAIDEIILALNKGNVKDSFHLSNELMKKLEKDYGKTGFTGSEKKSYQLAKTVHEVLTELDTKLSVKENIGSANLRFKDQLQKLKPHEEPKEDNEHNVKLN